MSARDDYPAMAFTVRQGEQWQRMCDEIDKLRGDVSKLLAMLAAAGVEWPQP